MADVRDYLEMRGDILLSERPLNDVDNVILASLSYLDFKGIVPGPEDGSSISMRLALEAFMQRAVEAGAGDDISEWVRSLATIDARFVRALAASERFGNMALRGYVDVINDESVVQFSALCIDLDERETYVSYRGTDNSLVGWREDFMLSFTVTEAQKMAADYLEAEAEHALKDGHKLYIGGHSKGGILAAYAALKLPEKYNELVNKVWSNDGPGMEPSILPAGTRCHNIYGERYVHVVPTYSVVGMLMDDGCAKTVVKSSAATALQHDPMTWQIRPLQLDVADDLLPDCKRMNQAINNWVQSMPVDEREQFTNELFDVLEAGGATTLDEVVASPASIYKVLAALADTDQKTRQIVYDLFGEALGAGVDSTKEAIAASVDSTKEALAASVDSTKEAIVSAATKAATDVMEQLKGLTSTTDGN